MFAKLNPELNCGTCDAEGAECVAAGVSSVCVDGKVVPKNEDLSDSANPNRWVQ